MVGVVDGADCDSRAAAVAATEMTKGAAHAAKMRAVSVTWRAVTAAARFTVAAPALKITMRA
eukprot:4718403-Pleurochrysis_carterae.AAC.2